MLPFSVYREIAKRGKPGRTGESGSVSVKSKGKGKERAAPPGDHAKQSSVVKGKVVEADLDEDEEMLDMEDVASADRSRKEVEVEDDDGGMLEDELEEDELADDDDEVDMDGGDVEENDALLEDNTMEEEFQETAESRQGDDAEDSDG